MPDITKDPEAIPDCVTRLLEATLQTLYCVAGHEDWPALQSAIASVEAYYGITTEPDDEDDVDPEEQAA